MNLTVHIPSSLRSYCDGASEFTVAARTVREALAALQREHPSLYVNVCDETGALRRHVNLFINSSLVDGEDFQSPLSPGDVLFIFQAVSGG